MADTPAPGASRPQDHEPAEPGDMIKQNPESFSAPPVWVWTIVFTALFAGVYFLGANLGNVGAEPWPQGGEGSETPVAAVAETPALDGAPIYTTRCSVCHQANGEGVPGVFPPLAGSEWVTGNPDNVIRIVLQGLQGPIDVAGTTYNGAMPGLATQMSDEKIAAVVSHVRSSFGNGASAVSVVDVARVRSETDGRTQPWTADELAGMAGAAPAAAPPPAAPSPAPQPATASPTVATTAPPAGDDGAALFQKYACDTCHSVDAPTPLVGPSLYDVGQRLSKGEIYEAIVDPDATVAEGYAPGIMSAMVSTLNISAEELQKMVDYLASLKG